MKLTSIASAVLSAAAVKEVAAAPLNPQPLPPGRSHDIVVGTRDALNPQPLPPGRSQLAGGSPALALRSPSSTSKSSLTFDANAPCSTDLAHYELDANTVSDCTAPDQNGAVHCKLHFNDHGTATTYDTGVKYQLTDVSNQEQTITLSPLSTSTDVNVQIRATEQGSGKVFTATEILTVTSDPINGVQVVIKKLNLQCT